MPPGVLFSIRDPEASIPARLYRHGGTHAKLGPGERGIAQRFRRDVLEPWKHSGGTPRRPSVPESVRPYSYSTLPAARPRASSRPHKPPPEITTKTPGAVLGPSPCWAAWLPHHLPHGAVLAMQDVCPAAGWLIFPTRPLALFPPRPPFINFSFSSPRNVQEQPRWNDTHVSGNQQGVGIRGAPLSQVSWHLEGATVKDHDKGEARSPGRPLHPAKCSSLFRTARRLTAFRDLGMLGHVMASVLQLGHASALEGTSSSFWGAGLPPCRLRICCPSRAPLAFLQSWRAHTERGGSQARQGRRKG
ncbi:hypothetical protein B0T11DRAFT_21452 [Plectosphaerella cucumerina]|uniref:Uncharacterized protein n=1 Tax=Plectosphaerella cucumerina TaxID=40658 RepID=A0A8K0TQX8_9PEZI|nr:hypothetical protein B0T11DRAFT_21452 [Plectosphaerella cucumerina]